MYAVNIFEDANITRSYNFVENTTVVETADLGTTGSGKFVLSGYDDTKASTIDMSGYNAFNLENETELIINDLTIQNTSSAITINSDKSSVTLNNVMLDNNIIALDNQKGTLTLNSVVIANGTDTNSNKVINNNIMYVANSTINSKLENSGTVSTKNIIEDDITESNIFENVSNKGIINFYSASDVIKNIVNENNITT